MAELERLGRGLHRPAASVEAIDDRCAAYLDVLPERTALGGLTGARAHGLWVPSPRPDERPEFAVSRLSTAANQLAHSERAEIRVRRRRLRPGDVVEVGGLPVLRMEKIWVDLGATLAIEDLVAVGDSVLRSGVGREQLIAALGAARGQRGVTRARAAFDLLDERSRSRPESHLRCHLVIGGLPWPQVNVAIHDVHGGWLAEPDAQYPHARLALEYNGADHAGVDRLRKDITRGLDVDEHGWKLVTFGSVQVFQRPWRIAPYVRHLLDERDPFWRRRPADEFRPIADLGRVVGSGASGGI
ncbi:MAG: hypothetical protein ACTHMS_24270 [Jatrophihabitans sp.]|uniref:hypothetical protein n=1 Tax=Jatrophihabitans sp. TaxID=1932789 RepID=UPI003F81B54F